MSRFRVERSSSGNRWIVRDHFGGPTGPMADTLSGRYGDGRTDEIAASFARVEWADAWAELMNKAKK